MSFINRKKGNMNIKFLLGIGITLCSLGLFFMNKIKKVFEKEELKTQDNLNQWANKTLNKWLQDEKEKFSESKLLTSRFIFDKEDNNYICTFEAYIQGINIDKVLSFKSKRYLNWEDIPDSVRAEFIRLGKNKSPIEIDFLNNGV